MERGLDLGVSDENRTRIRGSTIRCPDHWTTPTKNLCAWLVLPQLPIGYQPIALLMSYKRDRLKVLLR